MAIQQVDIQAGLGELSKLSNEELKELLNSTSNDKYDEIVNQSEKVKNFEAEREMLMASVKSLAEFNLARQNDYESDRSNLLSLVGDSNKLKEEIQEKANKLLELSRKTSLESTLAVLLAATAHAEEESENIAKTFISNNLDYDSFIGQYCEHRKLAHLRRIKTDRLRQETNESWTGIANSEGIIHDFGGSYYIAVDNFTFGRPTKYVRLDPTKVPTDTTSSTTNKWDDAIRVSANRFCERQHQIIMNNCHDHVADTLNEMRYNGRQNYTQLDVFLMITLHSHYVGLRGFLYQWGIFILLLIAFVILFVIIR